MSHTYPMDFTMNVNMDNAAFEGYDVPGQKQRELRRILQNVEADMLISNAGKCMDINGNTVGDWAITGPNPHEEEEE